MRLDLRWLSHLTAALLGTLSLAGVTQAAPTQVIVSTQSGDVGGVTADGVSSLKGIPFAAPPIGDLRWKPQPPAPWPGVRMADHFGSSCLQPDRRGSNVAPLASTSEDCLCLNVWLLADAKPDAHLPVMAWIYGGGFQVGSSGTRRSTVRN